MLSFVLAAVAAPSAPSAPTGRAPRAATEVVQGTVVEGTVVEEAIDIGYQWVDDRSGAVVEGWTTAALVWNEDPTVDPMCKRRWARSWCGTGTFTTEDGGEGVVELGVERVGRRRLRSVALLYDGTDALYVGEVRLKQLGARFSGVMDLTTDPAWSGTWDEPIRATHGSADQGAGASDVEAAAARGLGKLFMRVFRPGRAEPLQAGPIQAAPSAGPTVIEKRSPL